MTKSDKTAGLESDIAAIKAKIKSLQAAKKTLEACKTTVKSTYNNADSDHVDGTKYTEYYASDQKDIQSMSESLKAKKDSVVESINTNIATLESLKASKESSLAASRILDGDGSVSDVLTALLPTV